MPLTTPLPFRATTLNAARVLRDLELSSRCQGRRRKQTPLFADEAGRPLGHGILDRFLHEALSFAFDDAVAAVHSWHSLRIGLACSLAAAKATDAEIMLHCRWASEESLKLYRRIGDSRAIELCDKAETVTVDVTQATNLPIVDESDGFAALRERYADANMSDRAQLVIDTVHDGPLQPEGRGKRKERASPRPDTRPTATHVPSDLSPLSLQNAPGRRVLVLRAATWPAYECDEHGGAGWEAVIKCVVRGNARVHFLHATTPRGLPYADEDLQLHVLQPL